MNPDIKRYIIEHQDDDLDKLALALHSRDVLEKEFILKQLTGRQKIQKKVLTFFNQPDLLYPRKLSLEQSSSELTATYKANLVSGNKMADLTGGFGVDFFFIGSKFSRSYYIEQQQELCEIAQENFKLLGMRDFEIIHADAAKFVENSEELDLIFADPHRRSSAGGKVFRIGDCEPDMTRLLPVLLPKSRKVMIKLSPMLDIHQGLEDLNNCLIVNDMVKKYKVISDKLDKNGSMGAVSQVHVISVDNECKELLFVLEADCKDKLKMFAVNLSEKFPVEKTEYWADEEISAFVEMVGQDSDPEKFIGQYLYEPNASLMKAGAFKLISSMYGVKKLHQNTHLYISESENMEFPGRKFKILKSFAYNKNAMKEMMQDYPASSIAVRNFPMSAVDLRKKHKIRESNKIFLFACRYLNEENIVFICEKI